MKVLVVGVPNGDMRYPGCYPKVLEHGALSIRKDGGTPSPLGDPGYETVAIHAHLHWSRTWFEDPREDEK
jgi:hypothetical protein